MNSSKKIRNIIGSIHTNLIGKSIGKKVVIIESDDWGSIRMPNKKTIEILRLANIPVDNSAYCLYDGLETTNDVEILLNVLSEFEKKFGKKPIFTLNFVSANPNFSLIKASQFTRYFCEPFTQTYKSYSKTDGLTDLISEGIKKSYFIPAFHGRDHVNVPFWFELLKSNKYFQIGFDYKMWGLSRDVFPHLGRSIQATYDSNDQFYITGSLKEGLDLFNEIFNSPAEAFIANNYIWGDDCNSTLKSNGIKVIQGMKYQLLPLSNNFRSKRRNYFGFNVETEFTYNIRNCIFEPTELGTDVSDALRQINLAFMFGKPAVISTHRINFSSRISEINRDTNVKKLKQLLEAIITKWPDVIFESSNGILNYVK